MLLPRISTFADRSVVRSVSGVLHDAVWLVETRVVETRVTCVIDGTAVVAPPAQRWLEGLADVVGPCRRIVLVRDGVPGWAARWYAQREVQVSTSGQLDVAEARIAAGLEHGSAVWLVGGGAAPRMAGLIQALRALRPDLRLFLALAGAPGMASTPGAMTAPGMASTPGATTAPGMASTPGTWLEADLFDEVTAGVGGWIDPGRGGRPPGSLTLEVEAMAEVEIVIHAARDAGDPRLLVRPPLVGVDRLRVDAVTARVDEPLFVVRAVVQLPGVPWPIVTAHVARRSTARSPGAAG